MARPRSSTRILPRLKRGSVAEWPTGAQEESFSDYTGGPMRTSILTLLAVACGGTTSNGNIGQSQSCTVTLSGGVSGTYDCKPATTVWSTNDNEGGFTFAV